VVDIGTYLVILLCWII